MLVRLSVQISWILDCTRLLMIVLIHWCITQKPRPIGQYSLEHGMGQLELFSEEEVF